MVKPDYRRKGIASELIKCCLDELMKIGIMKTHIDVFKKNDLANSYWHKNGWELREDYLLPLSITIKDMSGNLGVSRKTLSKIINERGAITPD